MTKPLKKYMKMIFITLKSWVRERFKFTLLFFDEQFEIFAELARRSSMKCSKTTSSLRYENPICWSADMNKVLKKFRCYKGSFWIDPSTYCYTCKIVRKTRNTNIQQEPISYQKLFLNVHT